jgi:hypothetical protein
MSEVPILEQKYREKYNRELTGDKMGQFHVDFDMDNRQGPGEEIVAIKSIFLGKKSYLDVLQSKDKDGNTIIGHHIRLKGITKAGISHMVKQFNGSCEDMFEHLAEGKQLTFTLNPHDLDNNQENVLFEFKNGHVSTRKEFMRTVKF